MIPKKTVICKLLIPTLGQPHLKFLCLTISNMRVMLPTPRRYTQAEERKKLIYPKNTEQNISVNDLAILS